MNIEDLKTVVQDFHNVNGPAVEHEFTVVEGASADLRNVTQSYMRMPVVMLRLAGRVMELDDDLPTPPEDIENIGQLCDFIEGLE